MSKQIMEVFTRFCAGSREHTSRNFVKSGLRVQISMYTLLRTKISDNRIFAKDL